MNRIDDAVMRLCEEMHGNGGCTEFEIALGDLVGRYVAAHEKRMRDVQAAELLPLGPDIAAERLGVCRRSVYYMAERGRKKVQDAA